MWKDKFRGLAVFDVWKGIWTLLFITNDHFDKIYVNCGQYLSSERVA